MILFLGAFVYSETLAQNVVTPKHIAEIETVTSSQIAPDGQYIAYTISTPADPYEENRSNSTHLYLLDVTEGTTTPYHTTNSVSSVQFRPGQNAITFLSEMAGDDTRSLYQIPIEGGEAVKLFSFRQDLISYSWHNDGNQIAFMASEEAERSNSPLPYQADVYEENVPQRRGYIANVAMNSQMARQLQVEGSVYNMEWSPDGERIAVSVAPTPFVDDQLMNQQIFVLDTDDGEVSAEINNSGKLDQIEWSPNGQRLAIVAGSNINDPTAGRILIASARGGIPQIVNRDYEGTYHQIEWTDENYIHFLSSESTASRLGRLRFDGAETQTLFYSDEHDISSFSLSDSTTYSFVASAPSHPNEVFYFSSQVDGIHERMTYHNEWLNSVELGEQVVVSYQSRDGQFEIDGVLIYPVGYENGTTVPVITQVHGGPESHYDNGWLTSYSTPGQMAAGKGYAVFYPNYRGSTGRGIDFIFSSQADLAGAEFDDIVDGVDFLIENGIADPDRIGVTGGSYGGYASAWMSTYYSDRFAASVMFVGISNNISLWGESDIPKEMYLVHTRKQVWNNWNWFLDRSPIYHVANAQTPLLIMHGAEDTRVHPSQSLELYRHLKVRKPNLPLRLVYYPGEGHGNSRAASKLDYNYRMLRWFDTYLMTGDASAEKPHWDAPIPDKE
ncbi:alpha/beta hydrolase family protein [Rhodohalobacter sulfatireducens]|uniref:alpha/beta hydrolase family protein n=1 Tax=Rhodohalobacter sulfatireducens TaxID=2911366 RepID=UPI001EDBFF5F|nr:S9 family peptidase [Rhodohalobacter sulfatireducens]